VRRRFVGVVLAGLLAASGVVGCAGDEGGACPPLAIAFLGALTGPDASSGEVVRNSAALAVEDHNEANPDCEVGLVSFDSRGEPERAQVLARQIVDDPQVVGVVGPVFSGETEVVMPLFEEAGLPVLTPSATNPALGERGWTTFHRVVGTDADQGPASVAWLVDTVDPERVAVVDDGTLYGGTLADLTTTELIRLGVVVAPRQKVEPGVRDYGQAVESIAALDVDAVFFGGLGDAGAQLHGQLREGGVTGPFVAGDGTYTGSFLEVVGRSVDGGVAVAVTCPCVGVAATDAQRAVAARYREVFGAEPLAFAFEGYDAAAMLLAGIDDGAHSREAMARWLDGATYEGLTKTVTFDDDGEVVGGPVFVSRIVDGAFVPVARVADGEVIPLG
jgi:branched-chain amino acid transport system substrate-binding protein